MKIPRFACKLIRSAMAKGDKKRMKKYVFPQGEGSFPDVPYTENALLDQHLDIIKAKNPNGRLLIHVHGGAYVGGNRKYVYRYADVFLKQGYDVCLLGYRLVNEKTKVNSIDQINDCLKALSFLKDHLGDYGLENDQIALSGDSAGGHYALLLQEILDDPELARQWGYDFSGFSSKCVILSCPVYDPKHIINSKMCTKAATRFVFGFNCFDEGFAEKISPRVHFGSLKAPVFVSTCKNDFLNGKGFYQTKSLVEDLEKSHHLYGLIDIDSDDDKVGHVHNVNFPDLDESKKVNEAASSFMDECF